MNLKVYLVFFSLLLINFLFPREILAGNMTGYGVIFASSADYPSLKSKGKIDMIETVISTNWKGALDQAEANGQKLVIIPGWQSNQVCQGSNAWTWNGSNWSLNSTGIAFMDFIAGYIKGGGKGFRALYTVHEPYNYTHSPNCTTDAQKKLYSMLKTESANRGLTDIQLPLYAEIDTMTQSDFGPGLCDYCADWYYPNGECSGSTWEARVSSCITKMKSNYQSLSAKSPNSTFVAYMQSFGGIGGYAMPTASEMEYGGKAIINELKNNFSGNFVFAWYTWEGGPYPQYLKNSPGGDASYQVMANVYTGSGGAVTTTPTPTPPPGPADANGDGKVNGVDFITWVKNYGQNLSGAINGNFDGNGNVGISDYVVWVSNYAP